MTQNSIIIQIKSELEKKIIGQKHMIDRLLIGLLSDSHILIEGVPGLAKTLAIKSLAQCINAKFSRIQFTPDLLPSDVTGTTIFNQSNNEFKISKGPIFANIVLADEINRAPAKVQSALLEAMQERQVTIGETTHELDSPFLVLATQNPLEHEGTYPLPEAQLDRFMLKLKIDYPTELEEMKIVKEQIMPDKTNSIMPVATIREVENAKKEVQNITMEDSIHSYIVRIVFSTRYPSKYNFETIRPHIAPLIAYGASPRASINLALASKAHAYLNGRNAVYPEDVKAVCKDVLRHRIGLTYDAMAERITSEDIIEIIISNTATP